MEELETHNIMMVNKVVSPRISKLSRLFEPGPKLENMGVDVAGVHSEEVTS